jgi:GntR family transcriptional repressor for pyruvate dehydrogenase complex
VVAKREKPQQIADQLRRRIIEGQLPDGELLGHEPELIEQFEVSRPTLREALRILEAEGLITVVRGVQGGVRVHQPDHRQAARTAALVLQARNVSLADVSEARAIIEPAAVRLVAEHRARKSAAKELRALIDEEEAAIEDPVAFAEANARFHEVLVSLGGNQTMTVLVEMLNEVVTRAVSAVSQGDDGGAAVRKRGVRSQRVLADLIEAGDADGAEAHWQTHMDVVGKVVLGQQARTVVDLLDHY